MRGGVITALWRPLFPPRPLVTPIRGATTGGEGATTGGGGATTREEEAPYVQGQSPSRGVREYFYFIDHQGMVRQGSKCVRYLIM